MKISFFEYYEGFWSLQGSGAAVPFILPIARAFLTDSSKISEYIAPPLGDFQQIATAGTVLFLLLLTVVVFGCCRMARSIHAKSYVTLAIGFAFGVCALIALYVPFVKRVPVPTAEQVMPVSIGYQRSEFGLRTYPQSKWSDWEVLHDRLPTEEQIQKVWTYRSIIAVRVLLWFFYALTLGCFVSAASLGVYQHALDRTRAPAKAGMG
jgi:hypothetical protein